MRMFSSVVFASVLLLAACGGGSQSTVPKVYPPTETAVVQVGNNTCITNYTVHTDGTAVRDGCAGNATATVPLAAAAKLFADIQSAQPLNALPQTLDSDFYTLIQWNGQTSPNLEGGGASATEQTLMSDANAVTQAFPSQ